MNQDNLHYFFAYPICLTLIIYYNILFFRYIFIIRHNLGKFDYRRGHATVKLNFLASQKAYIMYYFYLREMGGNSDIFVINAPTKFWFGVFLFFFKGFEQHMKELINYCALPAGHNPKPLQNINAYLLAENLNGIELMLYKNEALPDNSLDKILGVHLKYWPYWMDFWTGNHLELEKQFSCPKELANYFDDAHSKMAWLEKIKEHLRAAVNLNPEYLVWHVANADQQEVFTWQFRYSDAEVLACTIDVFNAVSNVIPPTTLVLFENLWWPGLRLTDKQLLDTFFSQLNHANSGVMLDLGHLLNTNSELKTEAEAYAYALHTLDNLEDSCKKIYGIHLSHSLSGTYVNNFEKTFPNNTPIYKHIAKIDQHLPCKDISLRKIIQLVAPKYLVHELYYNDFSELRNLLKIQRSAFK